MSSRLVLAAIALSLVACEDDEIDLPQKNLDGVVVVPGDFVDEYLDGDPRLLGAVYVGVYERYDPEQLGYPYPATGPRVGDNPVGDALPYGGTSIGSYTYGCYRALSCKLLTGRFATLADVLEVYPITLTEEVVEDDEIVTRERQIDDEELYDQCAWYYGWNSIVEFGFIGEEALDFTKNEDGDYEAPFRAWHGRTPEGAIVYAFMDNDFTSCSPDSGTINRQRPYDGIFFREGTNYRDVLNFPDKYINRGDFVTATPPTVEAGRQDGYVVRLDTVMP